MVQVEPKLGLAFNNEDGCRGFELPPELDIFKHYAARIIEIAIDVRSSFSTDAFNREVATLKSLLKNLDKPFKLVIFGEFNAGKSSLINSLIGNSVAKVGVLPTTSTFAEYQVDNLTIVDTPGLNSIFQEQQQDVESYLETADLTLFVVSVERPLSESEWSALQQVCTTWRRQALVVVNKVDLCSLAEASEIVEFLKKRLELLKPNCLGPIEVSSRLPETVANLKEELLEVLNNETQQHLKIKAAARVLLATILRIEQRLSEFEFKQKCHLKDLSELKARFEQSAQRVHTFLTATGPVGELQAGFSELERSFSSRLKLNTMITKFRNFRGESLQLDLLKNFKAKQSAHLVKTKNFLSKEIEQDQSELSRFTLTTEHLKTSIEPYLGYSFADFSALLDYLLKELNHLRASFLFRNVLALILLILSQLTSWAQVELLALAASFATFSVNFVIFNFKAKALKVKLKKQVEAFLVELEGAEQSELKKCIDSCFAPLISKVVLKEAEVIKQVKQVEGFKEELINFKQAVSQN
jgi:small GTP-binding protein